MDDRMDWILIDRPSPFAAEREWQDFLAELQRSPRTVQVESEIAVATRVLAAFAAGGPEAAAQAYGEPRPE